MPATRHRDASNARVFSTYCCCAAPPMNRTTTPLNDTTPTSQTVSPGSVMQRYQLDEDRATADIASPADERLLQRPFGVVEPTGDHRDRVVPAVARPLPGTDDSGSRVQSTVCKRPTSSEFDGRAHARWEVDVWAPSHGRLHAASVSRAYWWTTRPSAPPGTSCGTATGWPWRPVQPPR